jgi:hypothetical protein
MNDGLFGLDRSDQLLKKLEYDFQRLRHDQGQETMLYTAFDFFVTAYSLVDWLQNSGARTEAEIKAIRNEMLTKICADLANGSKHFHLEKSVKTNVTTHAAEPAYSSAFSSCGFQAQWSAWVNLPADEAAAAGVPERCPIGALARKVWEHWRRHFEHTP